MLKVKSVSKKYGVVPVLNDITTEVGPEINVLIGINGSGKSTLLKIIAGIVKTDSGRVELNGRDITNLSPEERYIGYLPQHPALFTHKIVIDNIRYGMRNGRGSEEFSNMLIDMLDLKKILHKKPGELSGGYKSRVSLARALAPQPKLMLLDEPLSDIDQVVKEKLLPEFKEVLKLLNIPVLYVTHDPDEAHAIGSKFAVIMEGRLKEILTAQEAFLELKEYSYSAAK